jgi:hypothetical protein
MVRSWCKIAALAVPILIIELGTPRDRPVMVVDDTEALARVIRSEVGDGTAAERLAIGWAARNRARGAHLAIARMVCRPWCGPQHEMSARLRPMSSGQAATPADRRLAERILAEPDGKDPTRGADSFVEPALQDELVAQRRLGYRLRYASLRRRWLREGQARLGRVGRFELWRLG